MNSSKIFSNLQSDIKKIRNLDSAKLYEQSIAANAVEIRRNAINSLFQLFNEIRPDYNDLLDDETKAELLSLEMELRKWHKE